MAVITELIDAGLQLKQQGNLRGAIEHFRQLQATFPGNARILFELAGAWRAFDVPEQALPLYRELLALPKSQGLPPKDMPRLYTHLGATLLALGENAEASEIIEAGLRLHPGYRPLRAWRILSLRRGGDHELALLDALELMLESLAPSRWDIFEDDIVAAVRQMRQDLAADESLAPAATSKSSSAPNAEARGATEPAPALSAAITTDSQPIKVADAADAPAEVEVAVNVVKPAAQPIKRGKRGKRPKRNQAKPASQMGKRAVRIDIVDDKSEGSARKQAAADDPPAPSGSLKIPLDPD